MTWIIEYKHEDVEQFILELPAGLLAKYLHLTDLMMEFGANLGMPHTKAMLHGYIKKTPKAPKKEMRKAELRLAEVKQNET